MLALNNHKYAQCGVKIYDNKIVLQSYATDVIYIDLLNRRIMCTGLYSATTRKHISWFLSEYFPSIPYQTIRDMKKSEWVNMYDLYTL